MNSGGLNPHDDPAYHRMLRHLSSALSFDQELKVLKPDPVLQVLKGHLLIEEQLYEIAALRVVSPGALDEAKLTFFNLVHVVRALSDAPDHWMWDAILKLNALRNRLAHKLEVADFKDAARRFVEAVNMVEKKEWTDDPGESSKVLTEALSFLCGCVAGHRAGLAQHQGHQLPTPARDSAP